MSNTTISSSIRIVLFVLLSVQLFAGSEQPDPSPDLVKAATKARPHFPLVGEYVSDHGALQANMLTDGSFLVAEYQKGLPGAGWDQSPIAHSKKSAEELKAILGAYEMVERVSPTMGKKAPPGALLQFPNDFSNVEAGLMKAGAKSTKSVGSFSMHLEFLMPFMGSRVLSSAKRGNSGIYIYKVYEVQIMDTFALDYQQPENNAIPLESETYRWCGSLYKKKVPDVNMTFPPLRWQTYDIDFLAPQFEGEKKVSNARITVRHNGVLIHDDVELEQGTGLGANRKEMAKGSILFQKHGSPILFRNVWAIEYP
ncbi:MAG: DUF1080 domain-containing protein [Verrucomicrobiota bacterium]